MKISCLFRKLDLGPPLVRTFDNSKQWP